VAYDETVERPPEPRRTVLVVEDESATSSACTSASKD
jgi:hypothetical protein